MNYSKADIGFILYNNRSVNGVIKNFLPKSIDPYKLIEVESKFEWVKQFYDDYERMVEVDLHELNINEEDIKVFPDQLAELTDKVKSLSGKFNQQEMDFLQNRKFPTEWIQKYNLLGLSNFTYEEMVILGATCHPILKGFLEDGIDEGGILVPLFENGMLINCSCRRITDVGKLKYTLSVPDVPVWGLDNVHPGDEIWICEGLFDYIAVSESGRKAVSPSSAMWSGIQLSLLLDKDPGVVNVWADNDRVGLKTGASIKKLMSMLFKPCQTFISERYKDAYEQIVENGEPFENIKEVKITFEMIENKDDQSFNFLKYLKNRKF